MVDALLAGIDARGATIDDYRHLDGVDSLLSILQMPAGVPVATVAIGNATNAALLAVRMLAIQPPVLRQRMTEYRASLSESSRASGQDLLVDRPEA